MIITYSIPIKQVTTNMSVYNKRLQHKCNSESDKNDCKFDQTYLIKHAKGYVIINICISDSHCEVNVT